MKTKKKSKLKNIKAKSPRVSARKWVKENDVMRDDKLTWSGCMPYESIATRGMEWVSECGRYRIKRAVNKFGGDSKYSDAFYVEYRNSTLDRLRKRVEWWDVIVVRPGVTNAREYRTLREAFEAAELLHCSRTERDNEGVDSNKDEVLSEAKKRDLHELPGMFVSRRAIVSETGEVVEKVVKPKRIKQLGGKTKKTMLAEKAMAVLSKTVGKTMKEIVQEANLSETCYDALKAMSREGKVVKEGKTYRLKS